MKILLINPPNEHIIRESLPPVVEDSTGVFPPLGLLSVASYAEDCPGWEVEVIDCQAEGVGHEEMEARLAKSAPDVIGIQVMTFTLIDAFLVVKASRRALPEAIIIFGGPHPTLFPIESAAMEEVDIVVAGEGEYPIRGILNAIRDGKPVENTPAVVTKKTIGRPPPALTYIQNLDELKMPARHYLDQSLYTSVLASQRRITTMMSSRGCPCKCTFCDRPQMGKAFRKQSAERVVNEMTHCVEDHGIGEIIFYDDTFNMDRKRVHAICDLIMERGLVVDWDIRARIDSMTPEIIKKLGMAGCKRIHYGVESGSQRQQKLLKKNLNLSKVKDIFEITRNEGIETLGYFMIGLPEETEEELNQTLEMMTTLCMDYAHVAIYTPYPGTDAYRTALESGMYGHDFWKEFALNPTPDFKPKYWNENYTDEELYSILKKFYARFYRRPGYILQRLKKVRSAEELWRKGMLGIKLLKEVSFSK